MSNENNDRIQATPVEVADLDMSMDAVFLPGKVHGTNWRLCVLYVNYDGDEPLVELAYYDAAEILQAASEVAMFYGAPEYCDMFWDTLNGMPNSRPEYAALDSFAGRELAANYPTADFIGGGLEEIEFLVCWAKNYEQTRIC